MSIYIRNVDLLRRHVRNSLLNSICLLCVMTIHVSITNRWQAHYFIPFFFFCDFFLRVNVPKTLNHRGHVHTIMRWHNEVGPQFGGIHTYNVLKRSFEVATPVDTRVYKDTQDDLMKGFMWIIAVSFRPGGCYNFELFCK